MNVSTFLYKASFGIILCIIASIVVTTTFTSLFLNLFNTSILEYEDKVPMLDIQSALNISMTAEDHYRPFDRAYYASSDDWQP